MPFKFWREQFLDNFRQHMAWLKYVFSYLCHRMRYFFTIRWFQTPSPPRTHPFFGINPVACLLTILLLVGAGMCACTLTSVLPAPELGNITTTLEKGLFSHISPLQLHNRFHAAHAIRMIKAMEAADRKQLESALQKKNAAYARARWRLGLEPFELGVTIDGSRYHFWSDELVFNRYRADHLNLLDVSAFKARSEFFPWDLFRTIQYDQLPKPLAGFIIDLQIDGFGKYLKPECWPDMDIKEWRLIPDPVRKIAAYRMAWLWADEYAPSWMRRGEAARLVASIGRVESLFDLNKVVNRNPITGKADLGFMQISEGLRQGLRHTPEFKKYNNDDFLKPWVSIRAGAYSLFHTFLPRADGNVLQAIGYYNAGCNGPRQQAEKYLDMVVRQFNLAFVNRNYSPTLRLILRRAESGYFQGVRKDTLFIEHQASSKANN
jgi:hypothetical protein